LHHKHKPDEPEPNKKKCPTDESGQRILIRFPLAAFSRWKNFSFFFALIFTLMNFDDQNG